MSDSFPVAILFDVDNPLLDSDRVVDDHRRHLMTCHLLERWT